ncbi:MAG: hypothetical protein MJZ20_12460 [Bacteroidaceae bacterium]|nr:hypothetical protein [Bacteroidaceae bacterium]
MAYVGSINQIPLIADSIASQALGRKVNTAESSTGIVGLATTLSSGSDKETFYNCLMSRVNKTIIDVETWEFSGHGFSKNIVPFNQVLQMITLEDGTSSDDNAFLGVNSWESTTRGTQNNPYSNTVNTTAKMYLLKGVAGYSYKDVLPTIQIDNAFVSNEAMASFIGGVYLTHQNKLKAYVFGLENLVGGRAMYECYVKANANANANPNIFRNILAEYNTVVLGLSCTIESNAIVYPDGWVKADSALKDKGFMKYAIENIQLIHKRMGDVSTLFNIEAHTTQCKNPVVEVLEDFASAGRIAMSEVYHNDVLSLPNYKSMSFWQSAKRTSYGDYSFRANSCISGKDDTNSFVADGIIAFFYDPMSIIMNTESFRSYSLFNPDDEVLNTYDKAEVHWVLAKHHDMCVLQIADPVIASGAVNYGLNGQFTVSALS